MEVSEKIPVNKISRFYTKEGIHPYDELEWGTRTAEIKGGDGTVLFSQDVIAPTNWSDQSVQIVASKYFYGDQAKGEEPSLGGRESSVKQLITRVARTIAVNALELDYVDRDGATILEEELTHILVNQMASFNSPVWFNVGLHEAYGITETGDKKLFNRGNREDPYKYPQASACFIVSVEDSIDGIWKLMAESARLFKYGSGVGADWSSLRSSKEKISGGGIPSGPVSFMKVQDATGGTIKSGGKTRRAAIMQTLKCTHPDILEFVNVKQNEEKKAWALIEEGYDGSFNGPAYGSVDFQNVNQSVRLTNEFMSAVLSGEDTPQFDVNGNPIQKTPARDIMRAVSEGTWICGDPGVQFEDTIQEWHTCPNTAPINSSNPCSEYMFIDNSACNLASINLMKYYDGFYIDTMSLRYTSELLIMAMDVLVSTSGYPSEMIAKNSEDYRPLGLGFANLGALLMSMGIAYDSNKGREVAGAIMGIIGGSAYCASARLAANDNLGPFAGFGKNREPMLGVIEKHKNAAYDLASESEWPLHNANISVWEEALREGKEHGYRNSQVTVLAPTGTISFMMGCDTTGIEPCLGLVTYKLLAGEGDGVMKIVNGTVVDAMETLGYKPFEITEILATIEKTGDVEGSKYLKEEHLPVFATSFGTFNTLSANAHIDMMAACQPFISGAISKTVNLPESATVEDIQQAYIRAWSKGLKAVAIYRENSKRSQPLSVTETPKVDVSGDGQLPKSQNAVNVRKRLPDTRPSENHKFSINGHEGYLNIGMYPDTGLPGEIFITMSKQGSTVAGMMDIFATSISLSLQWGVPLEDMIAKFRHTRFEPAGFTTNSEIPTATSVADYIFNYLETRFMKSEEEPIIDMELPVVGKTWSQGEGPSTDAPSCGNCGTITVRAGSCYTCPSCGNSTGCG